MNKSLYDLYIGRPTKWGNPFRIGTHGTRTEVLSLYRVHIKTTSLWHQLPELANLTLGCWCHPKRCHGDALAELFIEYHNDSRAK